MFEYLKGNLADKYSTTNGTFLIVEVNGVGYQLEVSEIDFHSAGDINQEIKIYTKLIHKEDSMSLCGFLKKETRDIFQYLTSVSVFLNISISLNVIVSSVVSLFIIKKSDF